MTGKERVKMAVAHQEPDRVPIGEMGVDADVVSRYLGRPTYYRDNFKAVLAIWDGRAEDVRQSHLRDMADFYGGLAYDVAPVSLLDPRTPAVKKNWRQIDESNYECEGVRYDLSVETNSLRRALEPPTGPGGMPDPEKIRQRQVAPYQTPAPECWELFDVFRKKLSDRFLVARSVGGFFSGAPEWLMAYGLYPDDCHRIMEQDCENHIRKARDFIAHGADAVFIGGDYCDKNGPMMSPAMVREFVLPYLKRLCDAIHQAGGYVLKHTDGNTWKILPMFAEAGVDILQALEIGCGMDMGELKRKHGREFTFLGGVDCDNLVRGTPATVSAQASDTIRRAGPGGGLILGSGNSIQYGTPYANFMAMLETTRREGAYPLSAGRGG